MVMLQSFKNRILHCFSSSCRGKYDEEYNIDFHLPDEILIEILSKVPADRLEVFKLVCHHWRVLISSYDLVKLHMKRVRDKTIDKPVMLLQYYSLGTSGIQHFMFPSQLKLRNLGVNWKLCDALRNENVVGSCDGLLMLRRQGGKLLIVNPITQETRIITSPKSSGCRHCCIFFDRFEDDYKLLQVFPGSYPNNDYYIYSFNRDEWAILMSEVASPPLMGYNNDPPVIVNDALHWMYLGRVLVFKIETKDFFSPYPNYFFTELFTDPNDYFPYMTKTLRLMENDGKLCLSGLIFISKVIQIWVLQDYGNWGSWVTKFKIDLLHVSKKLPHSLNVAFSTEGLSRKVEIVSFNENDILLVCWRYKVLYLYNLKRKKVKVIREPKFLDRSITKYGELYYCIPFTTTLVSPNNAYTTLQYANQDAYQEIEGEDSE